MGSVFSPTYFRSRRRDSSPDPFAHCGINIAVYGEGTRRWVFTEPGLDAVERGAEHLEISRTRMAWSDGALEVRFDERTAVLGRRVRGLVRIVAPIRSSRMFQLDPVGTHGWWPIAPAARVEVELDAPRLRFAGSGYFDSNFGEAPLEHAFSSWTWSRSCTEHGSTVLYDVLTREGEACQRGLRFEEDGTVSPLSEATAEQALSTTVWRVPRSTRVGLGGPARVLSTLEDTPFYARSLIELPLGGRRVRAIHESLDLNRFTHPVVQRLLPFRMRRGWRA